MSTVLAPKAAVTSHGVRGCSVLLLRFPNKNQNQQKTAGATGTHLP